MDERCSSDERSVEDRSFLEVGDLNSPVAAGETLASEAVIEGEVLVGLKDRRKEVSVCPRAGHS